MALPTLPLSRFGRPRPAPWTDRFFHVRSPSRLRPFNFLSLASPPSTPTVGLVTCSTPAFYTNSLDHSSPSWSPAPNVRTRWNHVFLKPVSFPLSSFLIAPCQTPMSPVARRRHPGLPPVPPMMNFFLFLWMSFFFFHHLSMSPARFVRVSPFLPPWRPAFQLCNFTEGNLSWTKRCTPNDSLRPISSSSCPPCGFAETLLRLCTSLTRLAFQFPLVVPTF